MYGVSANSQPVMLLSVRRMIYYNFSWSWKSSINNNFLFYIPQPFLYPNIHFTLSLGPVLLYPAFIVCCKKKNLKCKKCKGNNYFSSKQFRKGFNKPSFSVPMEFTRFGGKSEIKDIFTINKAWRTFLRILWGSKIILHEIQFHINVLFLKREEWVRVGWGGGDKIQILIQKIFGCTNNS